MILGSNANDLTGRFRVVSRAEQIESRSIATEETSTDVAMDVEREIRFAVVMYGGVSLAIYINGVAQELLNMVRATAPEDSGEDSLALLRAQGSDLPGAMPVYRKLGQYLAVRDRTERDEKLMRTSPTTDLIRIRFVVDIISGTSAGGINGVFLAKALARNQRMDGLKKLWLSEGDLAKLLNDKWSIKDLQGFKLQKPQQSLLNSQRMYRKLLEALDYMDTPRGANVPLPKPSPLVRELDLFITTTDIDGIPLPISLSDQVVYERRFKNVFHFRYATQEATGHERDDFVKDNDPFLAFAARCTSSFPFAFDAMQLSDIAEIANGFSPYKDKGDWDLFFSDYLRYGLFDLEREAHGRQATGHLPNNVSTEQAKEKLRASFRDRSFGDGGYLDNKPFSYATSMLSRRYADSAVARKLLYVEPTPQHPELTVQRHDRPDFAENVNAAVLDLPRQETIREDMDRLDERNELLQRVATLTKEVDGDIAARKAEPIDDSEFRKQGLTQMIVHYGVSYGAYHRLKVTELTNLLTELIARAVGHDPDSDAADAIRELVRAWRRAEYDPYVSETEDRPEDPRKKTENEFLLAFDIRYHLRRLGFLNRRINQLADLDEDAARFLEAIRGHSNEWQEKHKNLSVQDLVNDHGPRFKDELNHIKKFKLAPALREVRLLEENLRRRNSNSGSELYKAIAALQVGWPDLKAILDCELGAKRELKAAEILKTGDRHTVLSKLAAIICNGLKRNATLNIQPSNASPGAAIACLCINHYRKNFTFYDLVIYPVQYGTGAGETNVVDVFRVSPEDARNLVDERASAADATKLAGRTLMSFGAFLDESWRRNDMLWGRLDGAERIIGALLPNNDESEVRQSLVNEAHLGIINEEIMEGNADAVCRLLSHALAHAKPKEPCGENLHKMVRRVLDQHRSRLNDRQITALTTPQTLDRQLQPRRALEYISRSTNISGDMFASLADKYHIQRGRTAAKWMAQVGSTLWNVIAVAVPQSLGSLIFRHLLGLFYFFAFLLIVLGIFLNNSVKAAGWQLLGILVLIQLIVSGVRAFICSYRWFAKLIVAVVAILPVALMILGGRHIAERWSDFQLNRGTELALAVLSAIAITLFFGLVPALIREVTKSLRRMSGGME